MSSIGWDVKIGLINLIDGSASPQNIYFLSESVTNLISNNIFIYYIYQEFLFNQEKSFNIDGHVVYIKFSLCQGVMYNDVSIILADFSGRDVCLPFMVTGLYNAFCAKTHIHDINKQNHWNATSI